MHFLEQLSRYIDIELSLCLILCPRKILIYVQNKFEGYSKKSYVIAKK